MNGNELHVGAVESLTPFAFLTQIRFAGFYSIVKPVYMKGYETLNEKESQTSP